MAVPLVNGYVFLPQKADWSASIIITLHWQTEIALAKRGYEDRASRRPAPQAQMAWQVVTTTAPDSAALEDSVRAALRSGQACAPCFPRPSYPALLENGGQTLTLEPSQWSWAAGDYLCALGADGSTVVSQVTGILGGNRVQLGSAIPATAIVIWPVVFGRLEAENGEQEAPDALSLTLRLYIPAWKAASASVAPTVFNGSPIVPAAVATDWDDAVNRSFAYDAAVEQIGFGAETLEIEQSYVQHGVQLTAMLYSDSAISDLESFLCALGGRRGNWWLPTAERAMLISAGSSASTFLIQAQGLADTWGNQPALFLYFTKPGQAAQIGRINTVYPGANGTEEVVLDAPLATPVDSTWDVHRLRLMRLSDDKLEVTYDADGYASVRVVAVELPLEYFSAAPVVPQPAYLYAFTARVLADVSWFLTSHAEQIVLNGTTYSPSAISHGDFERTWKSSEEKVTITTAYDANGPLALYLPFPPSDKLQLVIWRLDLGDPNPASTAKVVFQGFIASVNFKERHLEAHVQSPIDFLDRKLVGFIVGTPCNAQLFGLGCNLNAADWAFQTTFNSINGTLVYTNDMNQAGNYFAAGHLVTGAGKTLETRTIMSSGDSGGKYLVLSYPLLHAAVGQAVTIFPGCSHLPPDCTGKFNNYVNYQGQPLVPYRNPTLKAIDISDNGGGKK